MKSAVCTQRAGMLSGGLAEFYCVALAFLGVGVSLRGELVVFAKQKQNGQSVKLTLCPKALL